MRRWPQSGISRSGARSRRASSKPSSGSTQLSRAAVDGFLEGTRLTTDSPSVARALVADDIRQDLGEISCPTLVLWGARDNQLPLADGFDFARRLRAELRVIADCGHLLIGERPDACADAISSFVR